MFLSIHVPHTQEGSMPNQVSVPSQESLELKLSRLVNELGSLKRRNRTPQRDEEVRILAAQVREVQAGVLAERRKKAERLKRDRGQKEGLTANA